MRVRIVTAVALAASLSAVSLFAVPPSSARTVLFTALAVHITEEAHMLLRRPGRWASASAPMNLEGAPDSQQPDEPGEILTFGQPERRSRLLPGGIRQSAIAMVAAEIIIGGLALAVVASTHHDAASRASATTRTQQP